MSKQTALEWFFSELERMQYFIGNDMLEALKEAKQMERQQIIDAVDAPKYMESHITAHNVPGFSTSSMGWFMNGKQYYEINYGGKQ